MKSYSTFCSILVIALMIGGIAGQNDMISQILKEAKTQFEGYFGSGENEAQKAQFQLNMIKQFMKGIVVSELKLKSLSIDKKDELGKAEVSKIQNEVDVFVQRLFKDKYNSLEELAKGSKKSNEAFGKIYSESTFNSDIKRDYYQDVLANAILDQIFVGATPAENLKIALSNLDIIQVFLVKNKGLSEEQVNKPISYLKDVQKMRLSINNLFDKLSDVQFRAKLFQLMQKLQKKSSDENPIQILQDDPELMKDLGDQDWDALQKIKEQVQQAGGKAISDYYINKTKNHSNDVDEDEDEDEKEDNQSSKDGDSHFMLILAGLVAALGIGYFGLRKYRQSRFEDGTTQENKKIYQVQV